LLTSEFDQPHRVILGPGCIGGLLTQEILSQPDDIASQWRERPKEASGPFAATAGLAATRSREPNHVVVAPSQGCEVLDDVSRHTLRELAFDIVLKRDL
jgi:hypothetical protein